MGIPEKQKYNISIHSLRMEGDQLVKAIEDKRKDFNPLPPHGGRLNNVPDFSQSFPISIHSLRMEGDDGIAGNRILIQKFQSTPSAWRETVYAE